MVGDTKSKKDWYLINAEDKILGRLANKAARLLIGKGKLDWVPYLNKGDAVVVINAAKIAVTGKKLKEKKYYRHSGYPGGLRMETLEELLKRRPEEVIRKAVKGMLPRNKLAPLMLKQLFVYAGSEHKHEAQKPKEVEVD